MLVGGWLGVGAIKQWVMGVKRRGQRAGAFRQCQSTPNVRVNGGPRTPAGCVGRLSLMSVHPIALFLSFSVPLSSSHSGPSLSLSPSLTVLSLSLTPDPLNAVYLNIANTYFLMITFSLYCYTYTTQIHKDCIVSCGGHCPHSLHVVF